MAIATQLSRIANVLELVASANKENSSQPIIEDDSIGSCPNCNSIDVMQEGIFPKSIFRCRSCQLIWVNNADEYFRTR